MDRLVLSVERSPRRKTPTAWGFSYRGEDGGLYLQQQTSRVRGWKICERR